MAVYWKTAAGVLLSVVLILTVNRQQKDLAAVLSMVVCAMTAMAALSLLEPVLACIYRLEEMAAPESGMAATLLKILGIALISEIGCAICQDGGCSSLGKSLQLLSCAMILQLSVPLLERMMDMIRQILGEL